MEAMGTQAAFLGGLLIADLSSIDLGCGAADDDEPCASDGDMKRAFYLLSTAIGLVCSMHCILTTTYASLWGPGLALNGPRGSVSRAYFALKAEQGSIRSSFVGSILMFTAQACAGIKLAVRHPSSFPCSPCILRSLLTHGNSPCAFRQSIDTKQSQWYEDLSVGLVLVGGTLSFLFLRRMHRRFFDDYSMDGSDLRATIGGTMEATPGNKEHHIAGADLVIDLGRHPVSHLI